MNGILKQMILKCVQDVSRENGIWNEQIEIKILKNNLIQIFKNVLKKKIKTEYYKKFYQDNLERERNKRKNYYHNHKEENNIYVEKNKDKILKYQKEYQNKNKEKIKKQIKEYQKEYRIKNKEKINAYYREVWNKKNKEKIIKYSKKYRNENREKLREEYKNYNKNHKEKRDKYRKEYNENNKDKHAAYARNRRKNNIALRIHSSMSGTINRIIRDKNRESVFKILGYTRSELMKHLESKFKPGMSWDNYGIRGWHIDHIYPLSRFKIDSKFSPDFKKAWALSNLQPLWYDENIRKRNKLPEEINV